jgi:hypothetical protein
MDQKELMKLIGGQTIAQADEVAVFPAAGFEVDELDKNRTVITVHFFRNPDAYARSESHFMKFLVPAEGARGLAKMLNTIAPAAGDGHEAN